MLCRFYNTSVVVCSFKKQGVKLCKMMNPKAKRQWYMSPIPEANFLPTVKTLTKTEREPGKRGIRRLGMLNKLFMKHITDLMSTGSVAMDIVGRGIEISKVQVTPDFNTVNVFWVCKGDSTDDETDAVLRNTAGALRHELSSLRAMGEVPYIVFVKDKLEARLVDLDKRLTIADYGEDYVPTELGHLLKSEFTLNTKLSPEMKAKIKQLEDELPFDEEPLPEMTHTVYGLDHAQIMNRLLAARKKTRDAWNNFSENPNLISYKAPENIKTVQETDIGQQKQELAEFLLQRKILQNKLLKQKYDTEVPLNMQNDEYQSDDEIYDEDDEDDDYYHEEEQDYMSRDDRFQYEAIKDTKD